MKCLLLFLIILTVYNPNIFGFNLSNYVMFLGLLAAAIKRDSIKIRISKGSTLLIPIILFYCSVIASVAISRDPMTSFLCMIKFALMATIPFVLTRMVGKRMEKNNTIWRYIIFANLIACVVGVIQILFGLGDYHLAAGSEFDAIRVIGAFYTPNIYACFLCLTLPPVIVLMLKKHNTALLILAAVNMFVLYKTYSRASVLALLIAFLIWKGLDFLMKQKTGVKPYTFCVVLVIFVLGIIGIAFLIYSGKLLFLFQHRNSNDVRMSSILNAFAIFRDELFGRGIGVGTGEILDGTYFNIMVDLGIHGLLSLFLVICVSIYEACKLCRYRYNEMTRTVLFGIIMIWTLCILENIIYNTLLMPVITFYFFELGFYLDMHKEKRESCQLARNQSKGIDHLLIRFIEIDPCY